ncbi:serine/threonine-protein kinase ATR [Schistocerca nitens]|uniref:serine/threonine-protein kinase ATR n=1 Tax=Schistocerca nitens TaxID=7011 RepID=UPI002118FF03|nr:serine/threonine-protein kinase ATR [Schistocerca nitens]
MEVQGIRSPSVETWDGDSADVDDDESVITRRISRNSGDPVCTNESVILRHDRAWKTINEPVKTIYKNLDKNQAHVKSFLKYLLDNKKNLVKYFVPNQKCCKEHYSAMVKNCSVFNMWMFGRLFHMLGQPRLSIIHKLIVTSQIEILDMLVAEHPALAMELVQEYIFCLQDITEALGTEGTLKKQFELRRFIPEGETIDGIDLDLSPCFIHLSSSEGCANLQCYLLELLKSMTTGFEPHPHTVHSNLLPLVLDLLRTGTVPVQMKAFEFAADVYKVRPFSEYISESNQITFYKFLEKICVACHTFDLPEAPYGQLKSAVKTLLEEIAENVHLYPDLDRDFIKVTIINIVLQELSHALSDIVSETLNNIIRKILGRTFQWKLERHFIEEIAGKLDSCKYGRAIIVCCIVKELAEMPDYQNNTIYLDESCKSLLGHFEMQKKLLRNESLQKPRILAAMGSRTWSSLLKRLESTLKDLCEEEHLVTDSQTLNAVVHLKFAHIITACAAEVGEHLHGIYLDVGEIIFYGERLKSVVDGMVHVALLVRSCPSVQAQKLLEVLVEMAGCLMRIPERFDEESMCTLGGILAAPWLQQRAVMELLPSGHPLRDVQDHLQSLSSPHVIDTCIRFLAPLKQSEDEEWRVKLISQLIAEGGEHAVTAVQIIPLLLTAFESSKAEEIVLQLLVPARNQASLHVHLLGVVPDILCALTEHCIIKRKLTGNQLDLQLVCTDCQSKDGPQVQLSLNSDTTEFLAGLTTLAVESSTSPMKRAAAMFLPSLARHFPVAFSHPKGLPFSQWLTMLSDPDSSVRSAFSKHVHHLIIGQRKECQQELLSELSQHIMAAVRKALHTKNKPLQESLIFTLKTLGCNVRIEGILLHTAAALVALALHVNASCTSVSRLCLNAIVKAHGISLQMLFTRYRLQLDCVIVMFAVQSHSKSKRNFVATLQVASKLFGFESARTLLLQEGHRLLPFLFSEVSVLGESTLMLLLEQVAEQIDNTSGKLILQEFQYIYPYIIVNESEEVISSSLAVIEKITGQPVRNLVFSSFKVIHNLLILEYASNQKKVLDSLRYLAMMDPVYKGGSKDMPLESIADFLQPRFLGVLIYLDNSLAAEHVSDTEKKKALQSLPMLIRLMGTKYITLARFKVLTSLRIALRLNYSNFPELTVAAWDAYVHCLDAAALGALLSTVFISLLPLLDTLPQEVLTIFRYLIIERQDDLWQSFRDLYFVPDRKDLKFVHEAVKKFSNRNRSDDFTVMLRERVAYASHEIIDVRLEGLRNLKSFIQQSRTNVNEAVVAKEKVDRSIIELVRVLMESCHDHDEAVRLAAGRCLGELGAIDPGIMPTRERLQHTGSGYTFSLDVEDESFAVAAITELAKGFQKSKVTQNVDAFSYSIQELLKIYQITENSPLWNKFSGNVQDIMRPLLKSTYKSVLKRPEDFPCPIYGSKYGRNLHTWLYCWAFKMISFVTERKCRKIFDACALIVKRDLTTALYLLPYILLHALIACNTVQRETILYEVRTLVQNTLPQTMSDEVEHRTILLHPRRRPGMHNQGPREQEHIRACRVMYSLLDFLAHWLREWKAAHSANSDDHAYQKVSSFLEEIPKLSISKGNFFCREYACALKYLESHVKNQPNDLQANLSYLEEIYVNLNDLDGVAGTLAIQGKEPSLYQTLRAHEVMGRLQEASACYEKMAQEFHIDAHNIQGILKCYLRLDQPFIAMKITEGVTAIRPELEQDILSEKAEALWRLGQYDHLEKFVSRPDVAPVQHWGVQVGKAISLMRLPDSGGALTACLCDIQRLVLDSICETVYKHGAYRHAYNKVVELHIAHEMEQISTLLHYLLSGESNLTSGIKKARQLFANWDARFKVVQRSFHVAECVLRFRRTLLGLLRDAVAPSFSQLSELFDREIGTSWLQSARAARKGNHHQQAYTYLLSAEKYKLPQLLLEKVKLHWIKGDHESAFHALKCVVSEDFPEEKEEEDEEMTSRRILHAKALLLYARYNDDMLKVDTEQSVRNYNRALSMYACWEKGYVSLARFYDRVLQNFSEAERDTKGGDVQLAIVNCYGSSLKYGCKYIYQSMPRMLTLWLDYGSNQTAAGRSNAGMAVKMTELIVKVTSALPPYMLMTALSQLISRVCHQNSMVVKQLKTIIIRVLIAYPHYVLWMLMAPLKSNYNVRAKRCHEILHDESVIHAGLSKLVSDYIALTDMLIDLTNKPVSDASTTTVTDLVPQLNQLLRSPNFSRIIVPTQKYLSFVLPSNGSKEHNPFPEAGVHISHLLEKVTILQSMQKPRCITLVGSDGENYMMLCKPKDDLRKDFRLMEFNGIVNKYLKKDPDSRQRALRVRTYAVVPLNEECGIIEWVADLVGLRPMLSGLYKRMGISPPQRILKELLTCKVDQVAKKRLIFDKLLKMHPPILSEWFLQTFPDPSSWYQARTTYVRTCAVMSMVGYILGLGDRHGENVLLDCSSGGVVHVDFNCLFNKGENFDCPEVVPFRLTHNMVSAMGPLGVEGPFRRACEITLRLLRTKSDTLMCVLRPFVYDPIISWKNKSSVKKNEEMTNERAVQNLARIEQRLKGVLRSVSKPYSFPLSVEGQANSLIMEATSIDNLCRMYIGWGPYL